ncbi:MAG: glycosyltransferase family 2 protein [Rhodospirillales bacterium]|nr:glycosyltransferase family 2 protein [Rhodospirillales bacterium]
MAGEPLLSVVVPCFNEEAVLPELHRRLTAACRQCAGESYELVVVNDASIDNTWARIVSLAQCDPRVVGLCLSRNHGHQLALTAGLSQCVGQRILVIDADLQDPPELLPEMMALMDEGADVVYGTRLFRDGETWFKKAAATAFYRLLHAVTEVDIPRDTGDFRLMNRKVADVLNAMPERHRFIRGMVAWIGFRQVSLPYVRHQRYAGTTKYPLRKMLRLAADAITAFSCVPLSASLYVSAVSILLAGLAMVYTLYSWLFLEAVSGWASMMVVMLTFAAVQMFFLGVLGEYVGRIYFQTSNRPLFIIDRIVRGAGKNSPAAHRVRRRIGERAPR